MSTRLRLPCASATLAALALAAAASVGHAEVILSDDFEDYADNTPLPAPKWVLAATSTTSTINAVSGNSPFGAAGDNRRMEYKDTSTTGSPQATLSFTDPSGGTKPLVIQFDMMVPAAELNDGASLLALRGNRQSDNAPNTEGLFFYIQVANGIGFHAPSGIQNLLTLTGDTWYRVKITTLPANSGDDKFDVTIQPFGGAVQTFSGKDFRVDLSTFSSLVFRNNSGGSSTPTYYLDNFTVVPEPGSMSLLSLGALALVRRRGN